MVTKSSKKKPIRKVVKPKVKCLTKVSKKTLAKKSSLKKAKNAKIVLEEAEIAKEKAKTTPENVEFVSDDELDTFFDDEYADGDDDYDLSTKEKEKEVGAEKEPEVIEEVPTSDEEW